MNPNTSNSEEDYARPVAYDTQGQPLYTHPSETFQSPQAQTVYVARSVEPTKQEVSPEVRVKHDRSVQDYPELNLSEEEYIVAAIGRYPIGLILPFTIGTLLVASMITLLFNYDFFVQQFELTGILADRFVINSIILLIIMVILAGTYIPYYVHSHNLLFLTNESVIQEIQPSLFAHHEQTVSLGNIEDASYQKVGVIQQLFNYGSIRLSTEGEESTYLFTNVADPKRHIAKLNNAIEAFKNGRPVTVADDEK
jgi:hypothetical protein